MENETSNSFVKVEAIKIAYKQSKAGDIISFRIHPSDYNQDLATAPLGTPVILAVAEIVEVKGRNV